MKRATSLVSALASAFILSVVFQNCAGYQASYNPLTDGPKTEVCVGIACSPDLSYTEVSILNASPVKLITPASGVTPVFCDASTCVDIAGYCNTAGFRSGVFYYQWRLDGAPIGARIRSGATCDQQGRYRVLVNIPSPSVHTFNYTAIYTVDIIMTILDENGNEVENPAVANTTKQIMITGGT